MFTLGQLKEIMPNSGTRAEVFYKSLLSGMIRYQIRSVERMAAFLATIAHESGELRYTKELWGPTAAQSKYEGRVDLGNIVAGDGARFKGRGLIQITGRANYEKTSAALGEDFISAPEKLERAEYAALSACEWWYAHGCNELADIPDFVKVTKRVNGGLNGYDDRLKFYNRAMKILLTPDFSDVNSGVTFHDGT